MIFENEDSIKPEDIGGNPFVNEHFKINASKMRDMKRLDGQGKPVENLIEADKYTKVFKDVKYRQTINALGAGAKSLFLYIQYTLRPSHDYVLLKRGRYMKECNVKSPTTVNSAIVELCKAKIIGKHINIKNLYFVNPAILFCGSRIAKFPENIIVRSTSNKA